LYGIFCGTIQMDFSMTPIDINSLNEVLQSQSLLNEHLIVSAADNDGLITYVNDKFCEISGYSRDELLGHSHCLIKSNHHDPSFYNNLWKTISSGKTWSGEICNRKKSGELYWVKATIAPFLDESGKPYKYVSYRTDITDIKRQDEAHLALLNSTKECIHGLDQDGYCVFINPAASKALGFEPQALLGHRLHDIIHYHKEDGSELNETECAVFQTLKDKQVRQCEDWFIRKDKTGFPVELIIAPRFENGQFVGALLSYHDITHRRQAEAELTQSQQRLSAALNGADSGVWEWKIKTGELFWSERIAPLFGYDNSDIDVSYENFIKHIHPDDLAAVESAIQDSINLGKPYEIEHRIIKPNGEEHWLLEKGSVFYDQDGVAEKMLGTVMSIHERKKATQALKQTQERCSIAIDGAGDGVWDWDLISGEIIVSEIFAAMLGYPKDSLGPYSLDTWVETIHPDDKTSAQQQIQNYLDGKLPFYKDTFRLKCKDGGWKWILSKGKAVEHNVAGQPTRMTGIATDISSLKQLELELQQAKDYAEQANQAKSDFLSSMSHELRTPLNAILGFSQLLALNPDEPLTDTQKQNIAHIAQGGKHLLTLINEVLQLSAIEAGKVELNIQKISLTDVVDEVLLLTSSIADSHNIDLSAQTDAEIFVQADETKLKQVLLNLTSNAIKYNRAGGSVSINWTQSHQNYLRINVVDTGIGIADADKDKVFSASDRLGQASSDIEGTGIGLVVTKGLTELMGGTIGFDSEQGKGTTFWLELPLPHRAHYPTNLDRASVTGDSELGLHLLKADNVPVRNILYVEDNKENCDLMRSYFDKISFLNLQIAQSAEQSLQILERKLFDIVLMDINLPDSDGITLSQQIKAMPTHAHIPVIAMTANAMPSDIEKAQGVFDTYLTKPIDFQVLSETIIKHL